MKDKEARELGLKSFSITSIKSRTLTEDGDRDRYKAHSEHINICHLTSVTTRKNINDVDCRLFERWATEKTLEADTCTIKSTPGALKAHVRIL